MPKYFLQQPVSLISLGLLLLSYAIQGHLLLRLQQPLLICLLIGGYILVQLTVLTPAVQQARRNIQWWFSSNVIYLISVLTAAFFAAVALIWIGILENLLLIFTVETLTRIELQQAGLKQTQKLVVLILCLGLGLSLGWLTYELSAYPPT